MYFEVIIQSKINTYFDECYGCAGAYADAGIRCNDASFRRPRCRGLTYQLQRL